LHRTVRGAPAHGLALALAVAAAGAAAPARADGLPGGNCCADLEERVAELEATTVRKGNRRVSLTLSGQVSRQIMYWNDGHTSDVYSVDNGLNTSRFRFTGNAKISGDVQAGFMMEMDIRIGARSNQVTQIDDDGFSGSGGILGGAALGDGIGGAGDSVIGIRTANWYLESNHLGKLTVGRLNMATSGISTIDLSNAGVVIDSEPGEYQGAFLMRNGPGRLGSSWSLQCGGPSAAGPYSSDCFEHGPLRRDAVRYDTPTIWGFTASGAFGEDDIWDVGLRYAGEHHGFRVAAGVGYRWLIDREPDVLVIGPPDHKLQDTDRRQWLASASIMHIPTGLFVSAAYTNYDFRGANANERFGGVTGEGPNRPDIPLWWVDGGIQQNWTGWGATTFYGEWGRFDDGTVGLLASVAYPGLGPAAGGGFLGANPLPWTSISPTASTRPTRPSAAVPPTRSPAASTTPGSSRRVRGFSSDGDRTAVGIRPLASNIATKRDEDARGLTPVSLVSAATPPRPAPVPARHAAGRSRRRACRGRAGIR
jgi:predicted porin